MRESVYRPTMAAKAKLPLSARSVGRYVLRKGEGEKVLRKNFVELFWCVKGVGRFFIEGEWHRLEPSSVCFFMPGDEHRLECVSDQWEYRWMTIDGSMSVEVINELGLRRAPVSAIRCPDALFAKLANEIKDHSLRGQRMASATAYAILMEACGSPESSESTELLVPKCVDLIEASFQEGELNVNWLADKLEVNRSSLSRVFHKKAGITIIDYIIACRMQHSLFLLKETDMAIAEIAGECGYSHPDYFSKAFRKNMGKSPREFRGLSQSSDSRENVTSQ
ncbi:MAG: AraC family transcriptional regulator [Victivallales bacterium]|nr:AraC family transcriptional regulator [Victivallales bacterium]